MLYALLLPTCFSVTLLRSGQQTKSLLSVLENFLYRICCAKKVSEQLTATIGHVLPKICSHIVLPEVAHVADDPDPHKHGAGPKEDAADVITCERL